MTVFFIVLSDILVTWEKMAENNMCFERLIFYDLLNGQKSCSQDETNHWVFVGSWPGPLILEGWGPP